MWSMATRNIYPCDINGSHRFQVFLTCPGNWYFWIFLPRSTSWLPYSTYLHLDFYLLSRRWQPLQVCSKMFERLFRAGMGDLNQFFCKISMFDIWRLDLCDRFLPGCSHLTAGRLFCRPCHPHLRIFLVSGNSSFQDFPRFRKFLVSGIPRFRNSSFQVFLETRKFYKSRKLLQRRLSPELLQY